MKSCTCLYFEDSTGLIDPECPTHREDAERLMGSHKEPRKTFRESIRPPENFNRVQRASWYVGLCIGAVLVFVATGAILGLIIGLVRWLTLALAWWVGL